MSENETAADTNDLTQFARVQGNKSEQELREVLAELTRVRIELTALAEEARQQWKPNNKNSVGYHGGRDLMGQQIVKILNGATAKEVQEWLNR
jgi:hypothetical protein